MRRVLELDSIRGLAALWVLAYHLNQEAFLFKGIRVDLFFLLSGYLVTAIILKKRRTGNFYLVFQLRRALRLWPIYYLTLAAMVAVNACLAQSTAIDGLLNYLTFTQNIQRYWSDSVPAFKWYFLQTWSLALEQQFYLLWPLVIGFVGPRRVIPMALAIVATSVIARGVGLHWWLLLARCDGFALGSILAVLFADPERVESLRHAYLLRLGLGLVSASAFLLITVPFSLGIDFETSMSLWPSLTILGFNLVYFNLIGLVLCCTGHPVLGVLRNPRLRYIGTVSYGLYIFHPVVFHSISRLGEILGVGEVWWLHLVKLIASMALASASWHLVERPILALRDRFPYGPTPAIAGESHWRLLLRRPRMGGLPAER